MPLEDYCDRCGAFAEGRRQWMFYQGSPAREFFCAHCLKVMRVYAAVGFTLLGLVLAALTAVVWWLRTLR
jgi:hypothetical protein